MTARLSALAASLLLLLVAAPAALARDGSITSFDGTTIVYSFFPAPGLAAGQRAPTVMVGPGYSSGRASQSDAEVSLLLANGYNVLTWDPRGFGDSGGNVEIDSPSYEARDAQALIDFLAKQPEVQLDAPGDPRLGMSGPSYGGGIQWVTAALDRRVDVISPHISWNSLVTSLDKNDTAKGGWGSILFGLGVEGTTVPGVTGGATGQPGGFQFGRQQDPAANQALIDGLTTGQFNQADKDFFAARGPDFLLNRVRVPTLITQATSDTLFTLGEAIRNYAAMRAQGVPVKMLWFCGGLDQPSLAHGLCNTDPGPDKSIVLHETVRWFDRYLKGHTATDTGPGFEWVSQDGQTHGAEAYPPPPGAPLVATGAGTLPLVPGDASGTLISAGPATNAVNVAIPRVTQATQVVGEPTLTLRYSGTAAQPDARVYAQLVDNATHQAVPPVVTPVRLTLDGQPHTLTLPIEGVALTLTPQSSFSLQITDGSTVYFAQRVAGVVNLDRVQLSMPTVAVAAARGNAVGRRCIDRRAFAFRIHQHRKRVTRVLVYLDGRRIKSVRGTRVTRVRLTRLPQGVFAVRIVAVTARGQRVTSVRTYRGCAKGRPHTTIRRGHRPRQRRRS